jgi:CheY-like chemotaxis protein
VIQGYAEVLTDDLAADQDPPDLKTLQASVGEIAQAAARAAALTAQLLAFSRQQVVTLRVLDINAAVTTVQPMLKQLIGANVRLVLKLGPATGNIRADPGQIDQIVVNLIVNARDALPNGGTVTVETSTIVLEEPSAPNVIGLKAGPYVLLSVSDTGTGMDRETRDHLFEPFYTTKELGKGTGLGLATTHGIVHQAGGHISVYSEPGTGSVFKLYFPRVEALAEVRSAVAISASVGVGTVMVVEDEPMVRDMTTHLLERAGYEVLAVKDGASALEAARRAQPFDVLVTDVIMPNMSGIELAVHMMDDYPLIGVVLLSGYTAETLDLERVTSRGAMFVSKPITSSQLLQTVLQAVASRQAATERA